MNENTKIAKELVKKGGKMGVLSLGEKTNTISFTSENTQKKEGIIIRPRADKNNFHRTVHTPLYS